MSLIGVQHRWMACSAPAVQVQSTRTTPQVERLILSPGAASLMSRSWASASSASLRSCYPPAYAVEVLVRSELEAKCIRPGSLLHHDAINRLAMLTEVLARRQAGVHRLNRCLRAVVQGPAHMGIGDDPSPHLHIIAPVPQALPRRACLPCTSRAARLPWRSRPTR